MDFLLANYVLESALEDLALGDLKEASGKLSEVVKEALATPDEARANARKRATALAARNAEKKPSSVGVPAAKPVGGDYPDYRLTAKSTPSSTTKPSAMDKHRAAFDKYSSKPSNEADDQFNIKSLAQKPGPRPYKAAAAPTKILVKARAGKADKPVGQHIAMTSMLKSKAEALNVKLRNFRKGAK